MELEITGKRMKGQSRKPMEDCVKGQSRKPVLSYGLIRDGAYDQEKWQLQIKAKLANPY